MSTSQITHDDLSNATISAIGGIQITRTNCRIAVGDLDRAIEMAFSAPLLGNYYDVICHGTWQRDCLIPEVDDGIHDLDAQQLAVIIKSQPDYTGQPIRLLVCWVGQYETGFAYQIDTLLGHVGVLACTGEVVVDGSELYADDGHCWKLFQNHQVTVMRNIE
jgi:hypothetical protein